MHNTNSNSMPASDPGTPAKLDYFHFITNVNHELWLIHALSTGIEATLELEDWEDNDGLTAAKFMINDIQNKLKRLAETVDASSYDFTILQK